MSSKPKLEVTQSMIHLYEKCGIAFAFRYLHNITSPPVAALTVGRAVDEGITHNLKQKITSMTDLPASEVIDATVSAFQREEKETSWQDEDPGRQKDLAVSLVKAHHEILAPKIAPKAVQVKLEADESSGLKLGGTLDLIEKDGTIADSKTSKRLYKPDAVNQTLQAALYSHLYEKQFGEKPKGFRYDVLVKPLLRQGVRVQQVDGVPTEREKRNAVARAGVLNQAVKAGVFHYAPDGAWYCSKQWCGYWNVCPRGGKK